ncbi:MAG: DUF4388 domain-containing protein [Acidobacteria bacterium]|nr:DUF4388 domain-containing protein [Acidobacteriota bacterium]
MSIGGNLKTMPFPDLLQWVSQSRKTGTMVIEGKKYSKKVYFREGKVIAAASDNPKEFLSYYLVGWGYVSDDELQELLDMQERHGTMLGELLVIVGRLSREELDHVLRVKTEEAIYELFLWKEGDFRFLANILPAKRFHPLEVAVDTLVMEGVRRLDEWERIRAVIPGDDWIPKLVRAVEVKSLGETELAFLREINGANSLERIALNCKAPLFFVCNFVYMGMKQGLFELLPPSETPDVQGIPGFSQGSWRVILKDGERQLERGDLIKAYDSVKKLREKYPEQREILELATALERKIEVEVGGQSLPETAIPELDVPMSKLGELACSPMEGFLLSRVNGSYSLGEVLKLLPLSKLEGLLLAGGLLDRGIIRLRDPKEEKEGGIKAG